jgi:hypothetical protein
MPITGICQPSSAQANNNTFVQVYQLERRQTSTDRIKAALNRLIEDGRSPLLGRLPGRRLCFPHFPSMLTRTIHDCFYGQRPELVSSLRQSSHDKQACG